MRPRFLVVIVASIAHAMTAHAQIPSQSQSTFPSHISLVGQNASGQGDPLGAFTVVVRDAAHNPMPGITVWLDIKSCGEIAVCPNGFFCGENVSGTTNAMGELTLIAKGFRRSGATATQSCVKLYAQGVPFGPPRVSAFDMDGLNGVNLIDVSLCYADVVSGTNLMRSDHDGDGDVDMLDVSISASFAFGDGSTNSCPPCSP